MIAYRPSHMGLCVRDLERSMRFWCHGLGFVPGDRYELDSDAVPGLSESLEVDGRVVVVSQFITLDNVTVELLAYGTPEPVGAPSTTRGQLGLSHLSFYVDDVDAAIARLVEHGGTLLEQTRQNVGIDLVFLTDPDGTRVELMQAPPEG